MESVGCHVIYVHQDIREPRLIRVRTGQDGVSRFEHDFESHELGDMLLPLLEAFGHVHVCANSSTCMSRVFKLQDAAGIDLRPTIVLIDTPFDESSLESLPRSRPQSPFSNRDDNVQTPDEDVYGLKLLQRIISEAQLRSVSKLVIPIPVISNQLRADGADTKGLSAGPMRMLTAHRRMIRKCLDLGAVDVIVSPLSDKCITTLEICIYRAHREAAREQKMIMEVRRGRQRSWVGINEGKPYAYLREAMVSGLMKHICRSGDSDERIANVKLAVSSERRAAIGAAVGQWAFSAHDFSDDELIVAAMVMFRHALSMPELERWRIPTDQLINFLVACRGSYNSFVPYHNFRHVVDVLQATFHFLVRIGILASYIDHSEPERPTLEKSPIVSLLDPFEALTLLITAIGHDVGHPGVNNGFLITLNAPLAQLYNDRSVLESFHCAAYSQILRRYWPSAFEDTKMRNLMISSILATDMGLHFDYMKKLENTQRKLAADNSTEGWDGRVVQEHKSLACSLLIKCADISNVARKLGTAMQWTNILADEFARQASMEIELDIPTSLFSPPRKDTISLSQNQLGFMNLFALPLFRGITDIMPAMRYTIDELERNKSLFEAKIKVEQDKLGPTRCHAMQDRTPSPRTTSFGARPSVDQISQDSTASQPRSNGTTPHARDEQNFGDPFVGGGLDGCAKGQPPSSGKKQRSSETTDGSNSGPYSGEWAYQATSATTGKMPLSPSTQNTSIVSRESMDQQLLSVPQFSGVDFDQQRANLRSSRSDDGSQAIQLEDETNNSDVGKSDGRRLLKKKSSRFLNAFPFFKRNKGTSLTLPAADTVSQGLFP